MLPIVIAGLGSSGLELYFVNKQLEGNRNISCSVSVVVVEDKQNLVEFSVETQAQ